MSNNRYSKTAKFILGLVLLSSLAASCSKFLDVKPVGKLIPVEARDYENLLNNSTTVRFFLMDNNMGCSYAMMGDNVEVSELQMKDSYSPTTVNIDRVAAYVFYDRIFRPTSTPFYWTYIYTPIGVFNNVVDGVESLKDDSEYAKGLIAEAKAARAWVYMMGAQVYGPVYDPSGANDAKVLPLRTSGDPTVENGPLATTAEFFAQIKDDLDYAVEWAPASVSNATRASKVAAYALRAEYYMFTRDWEKMLADATAAWNLALSNKGSVDRLIYNFNDFEYDLSAIGTPEPGVSPEYYGTLVGPDNLTLETDNRENLFFRFAPNSANSSSFYPSEDWKAIFDKEADLRWKLFALNAPGFNEDGVRLQYFRGDLSPAGTEALRFSTSEGLTYPLLLLEKAEAEARCNKLTDALNSLNLLRKYRYAGTDTNLKNGASLSQDQLLNEILTERRREQPNLSFQRTLDLKRYALDNGKPWRKGTIVHKCGSKTYSKDITDAFFNHLNYDNPTLAYNPQWGIPEDNTTYDPYGAR